MLAKANVRNCTADNIVTDSDCYAKQYLSLVTWLINFDA